MKERFSGVSDNYCTTPSADLFLHSSMQPDKYDRNDCAKRESQTFSSFARCHATNLRRSGKESAFYVCHAAITRLEQYVGLTDIPFSMFTSTLLHHFEHILYRLNFKPNSVSLYLRMLRAICRQAERKQVWQFPADLFEGLYIGGDKVPKRSVPPSIIRALNDLDLTDYPHLKVSRDTFLLSFFLCGIPFVDLVNLRPSDFTGGVLSYHRRKTKQQVIIVIDEIAAQFVHRFKPTGNNRLLPYITGTGSDDYCAYRSALHTYNRHLKKLSELLGLSFPLTSYVARHSWATIAYHGNVPVGIISEALGHANEKMTYNYLNSFELSAKREGQQRVWDIVSNAE